MSDTGSQDPMYRRLKVPPEASGQQIRRAYRSLAHDVHPDTHPHDLDAARRFQEITEAYEVLGNPERRARYDRAHHHSPASGAPQPRTAEEAGENVASRPAGWSSTLDPVVIGPRSAPPGSAPLVAGPVHVTPPAEATNDRSLNSFWSWLRQR